MLTNEQLLDIFQNCCFENFGISKNGEYNSIDDIVPDLVIPKGIHYDWNFGASKAVFTFWGEDKITYVIKIPFLGEVFFDEDLGEDVVNEYEFSRNKERPWDYCAAECDVYADAKNTGLEKLFAKTELIGFVNNYPIYKQSFVDQPFAYLENEEKGPSKDSKTKTTSLCKEKNFYSISQIWLASVTEHYGTDVLGNLIDFIEDNGIGDLHDNNIGYKNGVPVIFDYSDFNC